MGCIESVILLAYYISASFLGLHKSVSREDVLKYKCMHAALCDKKLEAISMEVCD